MLQGTDKREGLERPFTEGELVGAALRLGAREVAGWSRAEERLAGAAPTVAEPTVAALRTAIGEGDDPLGDALCRLRAPERRRRLGATYTPRPIVSAMVAWAADCGPFSRVVDPGVGSGRFLVAAGRAMDGPALVGVEIDPLPALLARGHLAAAGLARRARVLVADYRSARLGAASGRTLFIGNPPYVRHHDIAGRWKEWLASSAERSGLRASRLAGLHVHFFLATLAHGRPGDAGVLVTAAEWLDVNYGDLPRQLLVGALGGTAVHIVEPTAAPFPGAITTAAISCFEIGSSPRALRLRRVARPEDLGALAGGTAVDRERLAAAPRWTPLTRPRSSAPSGLVPLGELCRVRRGQVTGANHLWIVDADDDRLPPSLLLPAVTRARELYAAGGALRDPARLRRVVELPEELDGLNAETRRRVEAFLRRARAAGADRAYVAAHRRRWWSVGMHEPAPILATYMARRPPAFVRNLCAARHVNIAHGLYPRAPMSGAQLDALAAHLAAHTSLSDGRTYAGGLTKFEPREMERLLVPTLDRLG